MAQIELEMDQYEDGLPTRIRYKIRAVRMGVGGPPSMSRGEHIAALLRMAAVALNNAAKDLEQGKEDGEFTTHLKIPSGDW